MIIDLTNENITNDAPIHYFHWPTVYASVSEAICERYENKSYSDTASVFALTQLEDEKFNIEAEIDGSWAKIAKLSRERWSKENPY